MIDAIAMGPSQHERVRPDDWITTFTGRQFFLFDPDFEDFDIRDLAHSLSLQCRFLGHCRRLYSVAEHCVRVVGAVAEILDFYPGPHPEGSRDQLLYTALMHDCTEVYLGDLPRPIKRMRESDAYRAVEDALFLVMSERFSFLYPLPNLVKEMDRSLFGAEVRDLMDRRSHRHLAHLIRDPHPDRIRPWSSCKAERRFLRMYYHLNPQGEKAPRCFFFFMGAS